MSDEWTNEERAHALRITQALETTLDADIHRTEASGRAVATGVGVFVAATYARLCVGAAMTHDEVMRFLEQYLNTIRTDF